MSDIILFDEIDEFGPQNYSGKYQIDTSTLDREELSGTADVSLDAQVQSSGVDGEYMADGTSVVAVDLECSRCLEAYPFANTSTFHVRFRPRPESSERENEEVEITGEEELDVEFYSERSVPLRDLAAEQVQLSIPMKPLCDESCLGLCPKCGANRTRQSCSCESGESDARWEALKGIREELSKKKDV
jgi:uncharacterized protein